MSPVTLTNDRVNAFVFGDLVIDHAISVRAKTKPYQPVGNEKVFDVIRRIDMAGGAANCARVLASLSRGRTYLWGVSGRSPWGNFLDILQRSHIYDSAASNVIFRGSHNDTTVMNTIARLIVLGEDSQEHIVRYDDTGHVSVTEDDVRRAIDHLIQAHDTYGIDVIILNDLDMGALSPSLIRSVGDFSIQNQIPLFVDPKRDLTKYKSISATAVAPNLREWCELIGESTRYSAWREELGSEQGLARIAQRSLRHFPNFTYHILKCDRDGAILIGPAEDARNQYLVYKIPPHPTRIDDVQLPHQLGCGDVMTATLALQFAGGDRTSHPTQRLFASLATANAIVAAYRQMPWQRLPTRRDIALLPEVAAPTPRPSRVTIAPRFLPESRTVDMAKIQTLVPGLVSVDSPYQEEIARLVHFLVNGWDGIGFQSAILTGRGGVGKTQLSKVLGVLLRERRVNVADVTKAMANCGSIQDVDAMMHRQRELLVGASGLLLIVDEAFKRCLHLFKGLPGVVCLETAHAQRARFLLIDADFEAVAKEMSESQFLTRCERFRLPAIGERPADIPYIFAAGCLRGDGRGTERVQCREEALLAVLETVLRQPEQEQSARTIYNWGHEAFIAASRDTAGSTRTEIALMHLPRSVRRDVVRTDRHEGTIEFEWSAAGGGIT